MPLIADEESFDEFVRAVSPRLLRAAVLLVRNRAAAEDLVQTAFERSWVKWGSLADDHERAAYVHRVMVNAFLRGQRRFWNREIARSDSADERATEVTDAVLDRVVVLAALYRLPPRQRVAISLRFLADLTESDTATAMGCSVGTVKSYSARAFATLRKEPNLAALLIRETMS